MHLTASTAHNSRDDAVVNKASASASMGPRPGNVETAELPLPEVEFPPELLLPPVAWTEPGAPDESVGMALETAGGFVELSLSSMYASFIGLFRQAITGSILKGG